MLIEIILTLLIGILFGTLTGLIPGIHINLISALLISASGSLIFFSKIPSIYLAIFIVSMAITHTFIDFIPSIFLGAPDTDTELSVLPGHELLMKGQGYKAILLSSFGGIVAILILLIITPFSILFIQNFYNILENFIPYLLIITSFFVISLDKYKFRALGIFLLCGLLGFLTLNLLEFKQPLLPLLTGLFGSSMMILSIKNKINVPKQEIIPFKLKRYLKNKKPLIGALVAAPLCSFLPGLGAGQAAVIGNTITKTNREGFLILIGATNTLVMGFSFIVLYLIQKTRTGAASAIKEILGTMNWKFLILIFGIIILSSIIAFILSLKISKIISRKIHQFNYSLFSYSTLGILTLVIFFISGLTGILIFILSTLTGIYSISSKVKRTNMMGCLLIPTILLYLI
ncbi:MAG: tripartite tricarboxylate transporter permease [Nanoarchaeota archaeon]